MNDRFREMFGTGYAMTHETPGGGSFTHDGFIDDQTFRAMTRSFMTSDAKKARKQAVLMTRVGDRVQKRAALRFIEALDDEYQLGYLETLREAFQKNASQNLTSFQHGDSLQEQEIASEAYKQGAADARRALEVADPLDLMASWSSGQ